MKGGPASHRMFRGRTVSSKVRGHFPSETGCFPSFHALWPLCLYKTPRGFPAGSGECSGGVSVTGLGWCGSPQYCRHVSLWMLWQATFGFYVIKRLELQIILQAIMRNQIPVTNHPTFIHIYYYFCYCHEGKILSEKKCMPPAQFDSVLRKFRSVFFSHSLHRQI